MLMNFRIRTEDNRWVVYNKGIENNSSGLITGSLHDMVNITILTVGNKCPRRRPCEAMRFRYVSDRISFFLGVKLLFRSPITAKA